VKFDQLAQPASDHGASRASSVEADLLMDAGFHQRVGRVPVDSMTL